MSVPPSGRFAAARAARRSLPVPPPASALQAPCRHVHAFAAESLPVSCSGSSGSRRRSSSRSTVYVCPAGCPSTRRARYRFPASRHRAASSIVKPLCQSQSASSGTLLCGCKTSRFPCRSHGVAARIAQIVSPPIPAMVMTSAACAPENCKPSACTNRKRSSKIVSGGGLPRIGKRTDMDVGRDGRLNDAALQQPDRQISVICTDIRSAGTRRHEVRDHLQPRRQTNVVHTSLPGNAKSRHIAGF